MDEFEWGKAMKAGTSVAHNKTGNSVLALNQVFGDTEIAFAAGKFEVWCSKSTSVWDPEIKARSVRSAAYRIVKRLSNGFTLLGGRFVRCEYAFVMRAEEVDEDSWRRIKDEFINQVMLLCAWEEDNG